MTDRVYPASKPNPPSMNGASAPASATPATANGGSGGGNTQFPPTKSQLYNNTTNPANRPISRPYRPQHPPPLRRNAKRKCSPRKCCCLCFIYTLIFLLSLLLLVAIAACIFYFLYRPKHPSFSVTSAKISAFNLSSASSSDAFSHLDSKIDFTISAKNPNKKIYFFYDQLVVSAAASGVDAGNATIPAFEHVPGNTTIIKAAIVADPKTDLDSDTVSQLKSGLGKKSGFPISVQADTKVKVKMGKLESNKVGIRVTCEGIKGFVPKKSTNSSKKATPKIKPTMAVTTDAKCKVDVRIKIWKFTF